MSKVSDKKDIEELIDILAAYYPAAKNTIQLLSAVQKWAKELEYPVNSYSDLTKRIQKKQIMIDDKPVGLEDLTGPIPSYYFPIASSENLLEKVQELYQIRSIQAPPHPAIPGVSPTSMPAQTNLPPQAPARPATSGATPTQMHAKSQTPTRPPISGATRRYPPQGVARSRS